MGEELVTKAFEINPTTVFGFIVALLLAYGIFATRYIIKSKKSHEEFMKKIIEDNISTLKDHLNILSAIKEALKDGNIQNKYHLNESINKVISAVENAKEHISIRIRGGKDDG